MVFKIGDLIASRYRVSDIIGSGGAGVAYRAHDQEIDVDVAVKVINAKLVQTPDEQRLFSRQTKIARKLSHQNIVRIFDEGRDEDRPFFTMQFLEGLSLRKIIDLRREKHQAFSVVEVEPIYNQLCQALDYAHKTTFHGNLKPDNVIVLPDLLKVTDFALLRGLPRKPFLAIQKSRGINSRYFAPEVRLEVPELDAAVDIYSLGAILCEMLTGVLFDDSKPDQIVPLGVDASILLVIKRCLARVPKDRYARAGDLYEDLRSLVARGASSKAAHVVTPIPEDAGIGASGNPAIEAETQRLDISRHGPSPIESAEKQVPSVIPAGGSAAFGEGRLRPRDLSGTGTFATIEDEMIESQSPSLPADLPTDRPAMAAAKAGGDDEEEDLSEATEALLDGPVFISSSAIELIADPRATNLVRIDQRALEGELGHAYGVPESNLEPVSRTLQPMPLPDSAIPEPAFSNVGGIVPSYELHGTGNGSNGNHGNGNGTGRHAKQNASQNASRTPKARPMTRPRLSALPSASTVAASPEGFAVGSSLRDQMSSGAALASEMAREVTGSVPLRVDAAGVRATRSETASALSPLQVPHSTKTMWLTLALSFLAVLFAFFIVWKIKDQQAEQNAQISALQEQIQGMYVLADNARQREASALGDAQSAAKNANAAALAEADAERLASAAEKRRARAEAEAQRAELEARKRGDEAKRAAGAKQHDEARRASEIAAVEAVEKRRVAEDAAKQEREERARKDRESKRREQEETARVAAEQRAERERSARGVAEEKAARLLVERQAAETARAEVASNERKAADERPKKPAGQKVAEQDADKLAGVVPLAPQAQGRGCPKGMVLIEAGAFMVGAPANDPERNFGDQKYQQVEVSSFCVDYYEFPNGRGRAPAAQVNFKAAESMCKAKSKRLCTEPEWEKACKGPSGARYPYGNQWDSAACSTEDDEGTDRTVEKSGFFKRCRSGYNVFDMSGNVSEWTATEWSAGSGFVVKGGASNRPGYDARCAARIKKKGSETSDMLGFRCCSDPSPGP